MKHLLKIFFALGATAAGLSSCKKEAFDASHPTADQSLTATRGGGLLPAAPSYLLTRLGADSLVYYNDGRLAKVIHGRDGYTQYNYTGFATITAKKFAGAANSLIREEVYQVDVKTGNVYESAHTEHIPFNGGSFALKTTFKYEYNAKGRLFKRYNKDKIAERAEFIWGDGTGESLSQIRFYDKNNVEIKVIQYGNMFTKHTLKMHLPSTGLDVYLNKFGKATDMVAGTEGIYDKTSGQSVLMTHTYFTYTLNGDGYPEQCIVTDAKTWQMLDTRFYRYLVK